MRNFIVYFLIMIAYYLIALFALDVVFYDLLNIRPTFFSSIIQLGIIISFWWFFLREKLLGPGGPFEPK